ncbi:ribokinase [Rubrivirga sp.]|uniref:ribokinase n=1 Tax=Rubrivirga sp. TaxID=1885344 RepID=UPI003B51C4E6
MADPNGRPNGHARRGRVLVVGSANMDLVVVCERFPAPGETVLTDELTAFSGGKGANQAVACARLGGDVRFLGRVGDDAFGGQLLDDLDAAGVDVGAVQADDGSSGVALITVDGRGENQIIVASGANGRLAPDDVEAARSLFEAADVVLLQLEVPVETVERAAALATEVGARVVLNPAPARPLSDALLASVDVLTPNESEAAALSGVAVTDRASAGQAARALVARGARHVVVTLGADGALSVSAERERHVPAPAVRAVDTTGAGDAFNGALAFALARGQSVDDALLLANAVGAAAVTQRGAQAAMPTLDQVAVYASAHEADHES